MKITILFVIAISLTVVMVKFFILSIKTGIASGFNEGLNLEPSEEDIRQKKLWNKWRWAYIVLSIIILIYAIFVL